MPRRLIAPAGHAAGHRNQAQDRERADRLAGAELADDADGLAFVDAEGSRLSTAPITPRLVKNRVVRSSTSSSGAGCVTGPAPSGAD